MSWFWFAIIALLCWSGSDFFSKIGCRDAKDKYSHLQMVMAVGAVMGIHAAYEIFVGGVEINFGIILTYLPVSLLYILSMACQIQLWKGYKVFQIPIKKDSCFSLSFKLHNFVLYKNHKETFITKR